ncbi:serine/threonine protein phosphatase [Sphaerisporangium aureirubrum]|uniref:Serine/threonine protein phosphatase n=1 Tax=Sphaerisporangium aureirubrum TaxID=1544736 RepID=A0ABW1NG36_9ACTN
MTDTSHGARVLRHAEVSGALAAYDDRRLAELVEGARTTGAGIGGMSATLDVGGVPVFVKRVPLTDLERRPENVMSTANLFGLPPFCQYGVGSPGFGAWRELAANLVTTEWVLGGRSGAFPLMYHWRVLPGAAPPAEEHADVERAVAYWGGAPEVRRRLHALREASASIVLFLEFVPHTLHDWLVARAAAGEDAVAACAMLESRLLADVAFMNAGGLAHFDAHFANVLTDGHRVYISDLGLATSPRFDLSAPEAVFLESHRSHDQAHVIMGMVNRLVSDVCGIAAPNTGSAERDAFVRACAEGAEPLGAPAEVAAVIRRYAPVAAVMNDFYRDLFGVSRETPYPAEKVEAALASLSVSDQDRRGGRRFAL